MAAVAILDYDMGNIGSIKNILTHIGIDDVIVTNNSDDINHADKLILPGVGSFDAGMEGLQRYGLIEIIKDNILNRGKSILGICLGMQLLGISSEEGIKKGLGLIDFENVRFEEAKGLKVPHMGWDYVTIKRQEPIVSGIKGKQRYYFVHSYYARCHSEDNILMTTEYGDEFASAVVKERIIGVQFHPEKSHKYGMALIKNFVENY